MSDNNYNVLEGQQHIVKAWTRGVELDIKAEQQLRNVASMPFIYKWVAAMPDAHWGMGATVGSVIATKGAIIPAAVGVDLGCGMVAARTNLMASDLPDSLHSMRSAIEAAIPHGRTNNGGNGDRGAWGNAPDRIYIEWAKIVDGYEEIIAKHPKLNRGSTFEQLGTLGTGNHFIEVCIDTEQSVWMMLHSGSRGVGNRIGSYFIERAKAEMRRFYINLPDVDLAYIPDGSKEFGDYWNAVNWAQNFAAKSRMLMLDAAMRAITKELDRESISLGINEELVNCHHNYIAKESHYGNNVWVTRKGAVRARQGDMGIIPGSMGAKSFIVRGKGNPESFTSCSHGAGRVMSRGEAKRRISMEDHVKAVAGVECRIDSDVIDESPAAYKDIDAVMAAQSDLVEIVHTLKQVLCVKG
jgi:tRNA-splicing ligase RtcB